MTIKVYTVYRSDLVEPVCLCQDVIVAGDISNFCNKKAAKEKKQYHFHFEDHETVDSLEQFKAEMGMEA